MTVHRWFANKSCPGYLYNRHGAIADEVNKRLNPGTSAPSKPITSTFTPYLVRVTADVLNIRAGAGINFKINGAIKDKGVYTIVAESNGWGKLKSGVGWISLAYTKKV